MGDNYTGFTADRENKKFFQTVDGYPAIRSGDMGYTAVDANNSTSTALDNGEVFTGTWTLRTSPDLIVALISDKNCTYKINFSPDGSNVDSTITFKFIAGELNQPKRLVITRSYYQVIVTNDSGENMAYLRMQTSIGTLQILTTPLSGTVTREHGSVFTRTLNFQDEVSLGQYESYVGISKFGENTDIDSTGNEDIWDGGGLYTGFPSETEELQIVLSDANDVGGKLTIRYLASSTSTAYSETEITTTGLTTNTGITAYRANRFVWDGTDSVAAAINQGTITIRHRTTTANVFSVVQALRGQSRVCAGTVPADNKAVIKHLSCHINKSNTATIRGSIYVRENGKTPRYVNPFTATEVLDHETSPYGGLLLQPLTDFCLHVETCSANNTDVLGALEYIFHYEP